MLRRFFNWMFADEVVFLKSSIADMAVNIISMDKKSQYIIVVKDEESARSLFEEINEHFDLDDGPRLIVLCAEDVKLIKIS